MVHERNDEITALFREDREAVYFFDNDALVEACENWLRRDDDRGRIGQAARNRAFELDLSHESNVVRILNAAGSQGAGGKS